MLKLKFFIFTIFLGIICQGEATQNEELKEDIKIGKFMGAHFLREDREYTSITHENYGLLKNKYVLHFEMPNGNRMDIVEDCGIPYWGALFYSSTYQLTEQIQELKKHYSSFEDIPQDIRAAFLNNSMDFSNFLLLFSQVSGYMSQHEKVTYNNVISDFSTELKGNLKEFQQLLLKNSEAKVGDITSICKGLAEELNKQFFGVFFTAQEGSDEFGILQWNHPQIAQPVGAFASEYGRGWNKSGFLNALYTHLRFIGDFDLPKYRGRSKGFGPSTTLKIGDNTIIEFDQTALRFVLEPALCMDQPYCAHFLKHLENLEVEKEIQK